MSVSSGLPVAASFGVCERAKLGLSERERVSVNDTHANFGQASDQGTGPSAADPGTAFLHKSD